MFIFKSDQRKKFREMEILEQHIFKEKEGKSFVVLNSTVPENSHQAFYICSIYNL